MNELYDVACDDTMGFDALHVRGPDEILMELEESGGVGDDADDRCRCVLSILRVLTYNVVTLDDIQRRVAFVCGNMVGWKKVPAGDWVKQADRRRMAASGVQVWRQMMDDWHAEAGTLLLSFFTERFTEWSAREVGKRVLITLYAAQADQRLRPTMAKSLEVIGETLGLTATNKRSAVSAALKAKVLPMFQQMRADARRHHDAPMKLWFMKNESCRAALSAAMKGKRNRAGKEVSGSKFQVSSSEEGRVA